MAVYYVKNGGNDGADGLTDANAWATISKVNGATIAAGSSVLFNRGDIWRESLLPHDNGAAGNQTIYGAYGTGAKPTISGGDVISGFSLVSGSYDATLAAQPYVVVVNGIRGTLKASKAACTASGNWYWTGTTLSVYYASDPSGLVVAGARDYGVGNTYKTYVTFDNLRITCARKMGLLVQGVSTVVSNCDIDTISGNAFTAYGIDLAGNSSTITGCTFTDCYCHGVCVVPGVTGAVITGCTFTNCWNGLEYGAGGTGYGIYLNNAVGALVTRNRVTGSYMGIVVGGHSNVIAYNVVYNCHVNGVGNLATDGGAANGWYNNTVYHRPTGVAGHAMVAESLGDHCIFKNNLCYCDYTGTNTNVSVISILSGAESYADVTQDYNLAFKTAGSTADLYKISTTVYTTLAAYQAACAAKGWAGNEAHSINADPLFVRPTSDWYLGIGSPAVDAGVAISGIGQVVLGAATDMGAYEQVPSDATFWADDFDGSAGSVPDVTKWNRVVGLRAQGNSSLETYVAANAVLDGLGHLALTAKFEDSGSGGDLRHYTSGWVDSHLLFSATHGSIQARIKIPAGQGLWPAFWMMPPVNLGDGSEHAEPDIMEILGSQPKTLYQSIHGPTVSGTPHTYSKMTTVTAAGSLANDFHVYGMDWSPDSIEFSLDGVVNVTYTPADLTADQLWYYEQPFYPILNMAVGGTWPGSPDGTTVFPATTLVDWVRIWGVDGVDESALPAFSPGRFPVLSRVCRGIG